ncbi:hypothetical protein AMJ47_03370 [Parcubacteria bacterium DG_72]|nr:MAG: hypothetical protein AMJ47_03370 [Parcubacteria bacterium DG_72]
MKTVEKILKPVLILFFTIIGFIIPQVTYAVPNFVINLATGLPLFVLWLIVELGVFIVEIAAWVVNWVLSPNFITMSYTNPARNQIIATGLGVTQSLVNMILILILIYIALATILRLQEYQAQKLLPTFIIIALLVNFTPVICGLIVDASNIIMNFFVRGISDGTTRFANEISPKINDIGSIFDMNKDWEKTAEIALQKVVLIPFFFVLAFVLFLFALLFMLRYMAIWILVILSPIAFIAYILPITRNWWRMWWSAFVNWCFIGVFAAFFLYLSLFFVTSIQASVPTPTGITPIASSAFSGVLPYLTGVVFLGLGFVIGLKTSAMGASTVIRFAQAKGKIYGTKAAKLYARELGGIRTAARLAKKGAKRLGAERIARAGLDKVSRAASRVGDLGIRIPGTQRRIKPLAFLKWATPKLREAGNIRPRVEEAEKAHAKESGVQTAQQILTGTIVGAEATGGLIKNLKQNDAQDLFIEAKKIRRWKKMSDQEILQDEKFSSIIAPLLKNARNSGFLGATLRRDPRLAKIAAKHRIGSYGNIKDEKGNLLTGKVLEKAAVAKAVNEARAHLNDWEPESLKDPEVLEASLGNLERERWLQVTRGIKAGQTTSLTKMDETFSNFIKSQSEFKGKSDQEIRKTLKKASKDKARAAEGKTLENDYWEKYGQKIEGTYGSAHYFEALRDKRFRDTGWREGRFSPPSPAETIGLGETEKETPPPPPPSPPPPPGRGPGKTTGGVTGMGQKPPKGRKTGGKSKKKTKPPRGRGPGKSSDKKTKEEKNDKSVQIPFMITQKMRKDLRERGYSEEDISKMTPQEAGDILKK